MPPSTEPNFFVRYATFDSPLGALWIAHNGSGICLLAFAREFVTPEDYITHTCRLPDGTPVVEDAPSLHAHITHVQAFLNRKSERLELTLAAYGTPFQQTVWQAIREIPYGKTQSYTDIAHAIGRSAAVRAVGTACGANPIILATPCHRVVSHDGSLGGFTGGLDKKERLLALEQSTLPASTKTQSDALAEPA